MRARAFAAALAAGVLAAGVLAAAPGSAAASRNTSLEFSASGSITVAWHGDPARGCAAAGMCGYSGTTTFPQLDYADLELIHTRHGVVAEFGGIDSDGPTVVRVRREVPGGSPAVCVTHDTASSFTLDLSRAYAGRRWLSVGTDALPAPMASGQCAGPRLGDFVGSLPSRAIRLKALRRAGTRLPLGDASVDTVVSTLVLRSNGERRESGFGGGGGGPGPGGSRRTLTVDVRFRVRRSAGEVAADFRALNAPICQVLDACGTSGRAGYTLDGSSGSLDVYGWAPARGSHIPTLGAAIAAIARRGAVEADGQLGPGSGVTTSAFERPGSPTCTDRARPPAPILFVEGERNGSRLDLATPDEDTSTDSLSDVFRTRCPGPNQRRREREAGAPLASARLATTSLSRPELRIALTRAGRFSSGAYAGSVGGRVELDLVRTRARVKVVRGG